MAAAKRKKAKPKARRKGLKFGAVKRAGPYVEAQPLPMGEGFRSADRAPPVPRTIDQGGRVGDIYSQDPERGEY